MCIESILVFFHCGSNTGYAIKSLERVFYEMAKRVTLDPNNVHISFTDFKNGYPDSLVPNIGKCIVFDPLDHSKKSLQYLREYLKDNKIRVVFGFDQLIENPIYRIMRKSGVKLIVSYHGAPLGSINRGLKLLLKRLEVSLRVSKPDHYIFESYAMAKTAIMGRGLSPRSVSVIRLGVDTNTFQPLTESFDYVHLLFSIPKDRKIIVYSGHMEERKGVHILIKSAIELVDCLGLQNIHFLILGDKPGEKHRFDALLGGTTAKDHITFGGYRDDLAKIFPNCQIGVIASTGWDSFTMSSLEMASCGLPLIASRLQGLVESVEEGKTGFLIEPGNVNELSNRIKFLLDHHDISDIMRIQARSRILRDFTVQRQTDDLVRLLCRLYNPVKIS